MFSRKKKILILKQFVLSHSRFLIVGIKNTLNSCSYINNHREKLVIKENIHIYNNKLRIYKIKKRSNSNLIVRFHWQRLIIIAKNLSTSTTRRRLSKKIMTRINVMI